jgi:glycosyltransferase involved in cell wall biosynthesis
MKIAVITPRYAIAGVPLAQIRFAQALFRSGHDVDLIFGCIDLSYDFPVTSGVNVINLNQEKVRGVFIPLLRYLVRSKPEIIFSAEDHLTAIVLLAAIVTNTKAKISGSSRVIPYDAEAYSKIPLSKGWYLRHFMKIVMWRADVLTCVVTDTCYLRMREHVEHEWFRDRACPIVLAAGALAEPKGFADLIQAINLINQKRMVRLIILGDGPHRSRLEDLVAFLNLNGLVSLPGYVENPLKYFASADVFALSSYAEGLPNVLVEAMMCGCTPVATDCPTGPREVLADGRYGYLVPMRDPIAMAAGIEMALNHPIPRELLAEAVRPFEEDAVLARHFKVLGMADS